MKQIHTIRGR